MKTVNLSLTLTLFVASMCCGCRCPTYYSQRVNNAECFTGAPAMMYKPAVCIITWEKGDTNGKKTITTTQHLAKIPVMYSVDVYKAPFGKTSATVNLNDDGQLTSAQATLDQEIPELITALGNLAKDIAPSGIHGSTTQGLVPDPANFKDIGVPVGIQFQEIN